MKESTTLLKTYSGERLHVVREMVVKVEHKGQKEHLTLTAVAGDGPSLLGKNWLQLIKLNLRSIKAVNNHTEGSLLYLLDKFSDVFAEKLGTIKSFSAKLHPKAGEEPKFIKPSTVPYMH